EFTFALWVRSAVQQASALYSRPFEGATSVENTFQIYVGTPAYWKIEVNRNGSGKDAEMDVWHHLAGAFDGTTLVTYLDGAQFDTILPGAVQYSADGVLIGCDIDLGSEMFHYTGLVDDVRLYDHPLRADEIAALAI
nr:LamG domain-containing protein [Deltaproteobacteria bacterium]